MFFIKKFITIFLVLFTYTNISYAQDSIVYLDLDNVVSNTQAGKSILTKLEKSKKKHCQNLKIKKKN